MRLHHKICLSARIVGNAAKVMAAPISPRQRLTISAITLAWIVNVLCGATVRCPEASRWLPRLKMVIVYSGISSVRFIRLSRICVANGLLLKASSWMQTTGESWRLLAPACGPALAVIRSRIVSASLLVLCPRNNLQYFST